MSNDLIKRLRKSQKLYEAIGVDGAEGALQAKEAVDALKAQAAEIERLRASAAALAKGAAAIMAMVDSGVIRVHGPTDREAFMSGLELLTYGDAAVRAALSKEGE